MCGQIYIQFGYEATTGRACVGPVFEYACVFVCMCVFELGVGCLLCLPPPHSNLVRNSSTCLESTAVLLLFAVFVHEICRSGI